jgi:hypothetical protein
MARKRRKRQETRYINQQAAHIHKEIGHKKEDYFSLDIRKSYAAMRNLSGVAYKMYIYLCQNRNNSTILLSGSKFSKISGASSRSYVLAKQELVEKRYLMPREDGDYDFYNTPYKKHNETVFEKMGITEEEYMLSQGCANEEEKS